MAVNKGLRRLAPSRQGTNMPDSIPRCRTAFRLNAKIVRHQHGTASVIPPEYCPPSVRNAVRHGPERAKWCGAARFDMTKAFFRKHADHAYSFTDCTSFVVMRELKLSQALTSDRHFTQAGFEALLPTI
jgi:hypothetical protein